MAKRLPVAWICNCKPHSRLKLKQQDAPRSVPGAVVALFTSRTNFAVARNALAFKFSIIPLYALANSLTALGKAKTYGLGASTPNCEVSFD